MNWFAKKGGGDRKEGPGTPEHYEQRPPHGEGGGKREAGGRIQPSAQLALSGGCQASPLGGGQPVL